MDTYEKKYKEALGWMQNVYPTMTGADKEDAEHFFPELAESEDERIKECIIDTLKGYHHLISTGGVTKEQMIAWLEKQGDKPQGKTALEAINEEKVDNANKVEPKFNVGDWITHNTANFVFKIINVGSNGYEVVNRENYKKTISFDNEDNYHLWTIQDAKDGDVLVCESGWTCIFKTLVNDETSSSYCFMDDTKWFCETGSECHTLKEEFVKAYNGKIHPATKEQRDLLFQKMKEAGYEWDEEKKELRKIEKQAPKPKWSDEDEERLQYCISSLQGKGLMGGVDTINSKWLKSLKQRLGGEE